MTMKRRLFLSLASMPFLSRFMPKEAPVETVEFPWKYYSTTVTFTKEELEKYWQPPFVSNARKHWRDPWGQTYPGFAANGSGLKCSKCDLIYPDVRSLWKHDEKCSGYPTDYHLIQEIERRTFYLKYPTNITA